MVIMGVCGLLLVAGVALLAAVGGSSVRPPGADGAGEGSSGQPAPPSQVLRRYVWYVTVAVGSGAVAGLLVAGAGGRLAMRLLAVTANDAAQGRTTEAEEVVGRITVGGTIGFMIFSALFFGVLSGALYLLVRRWLPGGWLGGLAFGGLLLVMAATRIDPLRADNPDFDIVGPGWVATVAFGALVLAHGVLVAGLAGRYSQVLPLISPERRAVAAHLPLVVLLPVFPVVAFIAAIGMVVVALSRIQPLVDALRSRRAVMAGRVLLGGASVVALPSFVSSVVDIAGRTP